MDSSVDDSVGVTWEKRGTWWDSGTGEPIFRDSAPQKRQVVPGKLEYSSERREFYFSKKNFSGPSRLFVCLWKLENSTPSENSIVGRGTVRYRTIQRFGKQERRRSKFNIETLGQRKISLP